MTYTAENIRLFIWEACGTYFLRCGGAVPDESLKIIRRILKSTTTSGLITTSLHRISSDAQAICLLLEDGNAQNPLLPYDSYKADAIFAFYRETSAL